MQVTRPSPAALDGVLGNASASPWVEKLAPVATRLWRAGRWGVFVGALVYCVLTLIGPLTYHGTPTDEIVMGDAAAYYFADTPYDWSDRPAGAGEYRYSPAFLWLVAPLRLLPWAPFAAIWFGAHIAVLLYLRVPWMLAFPGVLDDVVRGNINTFLALAIVLIVREAASPLWSAALLTKVTPGVAVVWHLARREMRQFGTALALTVAMVGIGMVLAPAQWSAWFTSLAAAPESYPPTLGLVVALPVRVVMAAGLAVFAARTDRAWLLPVAFIVAMPGLWPNAFALLVATVVLYPRRPQPMLSPVAMALPVAAAVPVADGVQTELVPVNSRTSIRK